MARRRTEDQPEVQNEEVQQVVAPEAGAVPAVNITWLGEDDLHEDGYRPSVNTWRGITFPKGEPVQVTNPHIIEKARSNRFFKVEG